MKFLVALFCGVKKCGSFIVRLLVFPLNKAIWSLVYYFIQLTSYSFTYQ